MCKIRDLTEDDLNIILEWRNHPSIRQAMIKQHIISPSEHRDWFKSIKLGKKNFPLIYEENSLSAGYVIFNLIDDSSNAEWGFYSAPDAPKGTGLRMGKAALDYAFNQLRIKEVFGQALITNEISQNFHTRLKFKKENISTRNSKYDLKYKDMICYKLKSSDWFKDEKS